MLDTLLRGWLLMLFVSTATGLLAVWHWRRGGSTGWATLWPALAVALAYWVSQTAVMQRLWPPFPPTDSSHWGQIFLLPMLALAWWQSQSEANPWRLAAALRLALLWPLVYLISLPLQQHTWSPAQSWVFLSVVPCAGWVYATALEAVAERSPSWLYPGLFGLLALASAWVFLLASTALLAQQAVGLGLALLVPLGLFCWRPAHLARRALVALTGYLLLLLWLLAGLFATVPPLAYLALLAPFSPLLLLLPALRQKPAWQQGLSCWGLAAVYLGVVLGWVHMTQPQLELYLG